MAAGYTETSYSNPPGSKFSSILKTNEKSKYWNCAPILTTASTDGFWEDTPEEKIKKKVLNAKSKFHAGRQLHIKHLPRDVTEAEICELLSDLPVQCVHIDSNPQGSSSARAVLEDPEMLDEWDKDRIFTLRGQRVPVTPTSSENMLCVGRLPLSLTEQEFKALVEQYGVVKTCFLMISEKTGENKGYGFVEFKSKEIGIAAKNYLDGKNIRGVSIICDWLNHNHTTFESLHSKCLYVDNLPKDFRDMTEFRKIFSTYVNPPYCQIALKNGCPLDWGLVEYSCADDAETAQVNLNSYKLRGRPMRVTYYIPGVRAINLYLKLLNDMPVKGKSLGLLPDPSGQVIVQSLQNLSKQNPIFAQNLQKIILDQIQQSHEDGYTTKKGPGSTGSQEDNKSIPSIPTTAPHPPPPPFRPEDHKIPIPPVLPPPPPSHMLLKSGIHTPFMKPTHRAGINTSPPVGEAAPPTLEENLLATQALYNSLLCPPPTAYGLPPNPYLDPNLSFDLQQNILNILSNPQSVEQLLAGLPPNTIPYMFPTMPNFDPQWLHPLLTSTLSIPNPPPPPPMNFLDMKASFPGWSTPPPSLLPTSTQSMPHFNPQPGAPAWTSPPPPLPVTSSVLSTPIGQKRPLPISPESSPEGNYIGQHSQGLGGHYADSYFKRKKSN